MHVQKHKIPHRNFSEGFFFISGIFESVGQSLGMVIL